MGRLIDATRLKNAIRIQSYKGHELTLDYLLGMIDGLPEVEAVPKAMVDEAIEQIVKERDECYRSEYNHGMGWGFQSALEILERNLGGRNG